MVILDDPATMQASLVESEAVGMASVRMLRALPAQQSPERLIGFGIVVAHAIEFEYL